jgi:hypothetical protein
MSARGRRLRVSFRESLRGTYWRLASPVDELAIVIDFEAWIDDVRDYAREKTWTLRGSVVAEGLASRREVRGSIVSRILDHGRVFYRVGFVGDDGVSYQLCGQQEWSGLVPLDSLSVIDGSLEDRDGTECARVRLRFDLRRAGLRLLRTLRVRWASDTVASRL